MYLFYFFIILFLSYDSFPLQRKLIYKITVNKSVGRGQSILSHLTCEVGCIPEAETRGTGTCQPACSYQRLDSPPAEGGPLAASPEACSPRQPHAVMTGVRNRRTMSKFTRYHNTTHLLIQNSHDYGLLNW